MRNSFERLNVRIILQTGLTFVVNVVVALVLAKTTGQRSNDPPVTAFSRLPRQILDLYRLMPLKNLTREVILVSFQDSVIVHRDTNCKGQRARLKLGLHPIETNKNTAKLGTHQATSPYDYSL